MPHYHRYIGFEKRHLILRQAFFTPFFIVSEFLTPIGVKNFWRKKLAHYLSFLRQIFLRHF